MPASSTLLPNCVNSSILAPHSQHFICFVTYEWIKEARVLQYTTLERLAREKRSSLFGPFVRYRENKDL
jgi:hypothetical protein